MKRPLWVIGLAYAAGLLVAALAGLNTSLWLGVVCLLLLAGALLFPALRRRAAVTAVLLTGAAAFLPASPSSAPPGHTPLKSL